MALQFARDEQFVQRDNRRVSLGGRRWPVLRAEYGLGLNNVLGSDFSYQKVKFSAKQKLSLGLLGTSQYILEGGYIFSPLPFPLLEVHLGNTSPFYYRQGFNTMNRAEFVSDHYASLRYSHSFEGFFPEPHSFVASVGVASDHLPPMSSMEEFAPKIAPLSP